MTGFRPFSVAHLLTVAGLALALAAFMAAGLSARRNGSERRFERVAGAVGLAFWAVYNSYAIVRWGFSWRDSLPLQVCDVTALSAAMVFLTSSRLPRTISYFWGIALSSQGIFTPDLVGGPATIAFWGFWMYHAIVVGAGVYAVIVRGYRPEWRDFFIAASLGLVYACAALVLDAATGANYGYLGRPGSSQPSLIDVLGPWPRRVPLMIALALSAMAVLQIPWSVRATRLQRDDRLRNAGAQG
jgi:hypothetical integral membrane protein (TIGR02206 family)